MFNRRAVSRYHLVHPLPGYIEHGEIRHRSEIVELSTVGVRLRVRNLPEEKLLAPTAAHDFAEIVHAADGIAGFGGIRHVRSDGSDLWVGFKWDDFHVGENIHKSFSIIGELVAQGAAGCVNVRQDMVDLGGHVSSVLSEDLQQCVARGFRRISLGDCTSIDAGGVAMLGGLAGLGVQFQDMGPEVSALLRQYRRQGRQPVH